MQEETQEREDESPLEGEVLFQTDKAARTG